MTKFICPAVPVFSLDTIYLYCCELQVCLLAVLFHSEYCECSQPFNVRMASTADIVVLRKGFSYNNLYYRSVAISEGYFR